MVRAVIFDCDGVLADSEPIHLKAFQEVLRGVGIELTREEYFEGYLGLDDRDCFRAVLEAHGRPPREGELRDLCRSKAARVPELLRSELVVYPGVRTLVEGAAERWPLAVASGALRREIELVLERAGVAGRFRAIVSAEDVARGKPDPEGFLRAARLLREASGSDLAPSEVVVIEDSPWGVRAAHAAGMRAVAVATNYPKEALAEADLVVAAPGDLDPARLAGAVAGEGPA